MNSNWNPLPERPSPTSVRVFGVELRKGNKVRLWPQKTADIMDMALRGKVAVVEAIELDLDNQVHLAVVIDADPGRDLGMLRQPGHQRMRRRGDVHGVRRDRRVGQELPAQHLREPSQHPGRPVHAAGQQRRVDCRVRPVQRQPPPAPRNETSPGFGLGSLESIEEIEVTWPKGEKETFACGALDKMITLKKGKGTRMVRPPEGTGSDKGSPGKKSR